MNRIDPVSRRVTVLRAPAGFGKTTVLGETCRNLKQAGLTVAWVALDEHDSRQVLDAHLTFAFQQSGFDVESSNGLRNPKDPFSHRTAWLVHQIELHGTPCVLALDEFERLRDPSSVALVNFLLERSPPNLHIVIACREIPVTLDLATRVLDGRALVFTVDDLRFSKPEVAGFFGFRPSRPEVASLTRQSRGWPIALRILQNERDGATAQSAPQASEVAENWVESRLWRGLQQSDRELLLDIGLFEWVDESLLDEVFDGDVLSRRVKHIPALVGLFESVSGENFDTWRLHPLVREQCERQRLREAPERYRTIHQRLARALARRGEPVTAVHHAAQAGDVEFIAEILKSQGGLRLWLREGFDRLQTVDALLTEELMEEHPRLALSHCVYLILTGKLNEARQTWEAVVGRNSIAARGGGEGDIDFRVDACNVRALLSLYGGEHLDSEGLDALLADHRRFLELPNIDPAVRYALECGLSVAHNMRAEFDEAIHHAAQAERCCGDHHQMMIYVEVQRGQVAMARGEVSEAMNRYASAQRYVNASFLLDPLQSAYTTVLVRELDLERNRIVGMERALQVPQAFVERALPFATHAAAVSVTLELISQFKGIEDALSSVRAMLHHASNAAFVSLERYLTGCLIEMLIAQGQVGNAERLWQQARLPLDTNGCLDLQGQTWREMELLACARLRLFVAREEFDAGRWFANDLLSVAETRNLRRTQMRGLSLLIALEHSAGALPQAMVHMEQFLSLFSRTDYARSLVRVRNSSLPVLEAWIEDNGKSPLHESASRLSGMLNDTENTARPAPTFSAVELDILQRMESQRDKEIAQAIGITEAGVRYHIGKIFKKLGVRGRRNAAERARRFGLLP